MMLEDEIIKEAEWWKDDQFIDELDKRYAGRAGRKRVHII